MNPIEKTIRTALERGDAEDRAYREKVYRSVYAALEKSNAASPDLPEEAVQHRRELLKTSIRTIEQEFMAALDPEEDIETPQADEPFDEPPAPDAFEPVPQPPARQREPQSSWAAASNRYYGDEHEAEPVETARQPRQIYEAPVHAPAPQPYDDGEAIPLPDIEPRASRDNDSYRAADPGLGDLVASREPRIARRHHDDRDVDEPRPRRRRGRFFIILFLAVTLLAAGAMSIWWAMESGLFLSAEERDTSVPNPPLTLDDEDYQPDAPPPLSEQEAADGRSDDWITVFTPTDPTRVITPPGGSAQVIEIEGGTALRIRSASPDQPVLFEIGEGILQDIAGRRAVFNIRARTDQGAETQMLVTCDFGSLGDCGRNRPFVSSENRDFLVARDIPNASPTGAGSIAIASDVGNGGLSVDIIDIRVGVPD